MSAEAAVVVRSWKVGRYTATLSAPRPRPGEQVSATIEWAPGIPHDLTERDFDKYRIGRNRAFAELCSELGITGALVELPA